MSLSESDRMISQVRSSDPSFTNKIRLRFEMIPEEIMLFSSSRNKGGLAKDGFLIETGDHDPQRR